MEWISPLGLPVSQMAYKSRVNQSSVEEVLLMARDRNVLINQKANVYGAFPEVNSVRARNQIPPNFVHSIDASHAQICHIYCALKGEQNEREGVGEPIIFNSIHDSFWVHPNNVAELNKQIRDGFVDIYRNVRKQIY
jgi:DNA-directed RNA polymerase